MFPFVNTKTEEEWPYNKMVQNILKEHLLLNNATAFNMYNAMTAFREPCITSEGGTWTIGNDVTMLECKHKAER